MEEGINFYAPEWREKITRVFTDCAEKGIPFDEEMQIITKNEKRVWVRTTGEAVTDENGKIVEVQGAFQDITDRKHLEAAEEENRKLLEAIYRNAPLVLMVVDENRRIKQINGFASQFAGRPAEEMLGLRGGEALRCLHAIDHHEGCGFGQACKQCVIRNTVLDTLINGTTNLQVEAPYSLLTETETRQLTLLVSSTPVTFKGSQMALVTLQDITELKKAEQERENLQTQLRDAQKMEAIGTLAGGIAHDFNNILSSIIGYTELSLDEVREKTQLHQNLSQVLASGTRAKDLVRQILTLSRHEKQEFKPTPVIPLVKEAIKMLRSAVPSSIDFRENFPTQNLLVEADPTQIHQVIVNLVTNAMQAMRQENGILEVSIAPAILDENILKEHPDITPGKFVQITLSDTGAGISEHYLDKIFEPYFTTKQKGTGTGLGLSMVYGIVKKHKGFINVESKPGKGSTFNVFLPLVEHDFTIATEQKSETLPVGTENILLVDDEKQIVDIQKQMLERLGYRVFPMTGSLEALKAFRAAPDNFDLLITDMTMPGMTGDKLAQAVKELRPELPVILCTGFSEKVDTDKDGLQTEAILMKPVSKADMAKTIRKVLNGKGI
ncbi:MAG: response regulator [Desulfobacteraceae bacterium]|nr:response regulator [Desulfobacteraceae bacterium]